MAKIKKDEGESRRLPLTDWDIFPWSSEMYQRHEQDFQNILKEYKEIRNINDNAIMARNVWLERKGGIVIKNTGIEATLKYQTITSMFDRFSEWLSFKEKREMTQEQMKEKIDKIKNGMKKADFSIPKNIQDMANSDILDDEILKDALDNF